MTNQYVTLGIMIGAWLFKAVIFFSCLLYYFSQRSKKMLWFCLLIYLGGLLANDLTFILHYWMRTINHIAGDIPAFTFYCRICWSIYITEIQTIALFFEYLINKRITWHPLTSAFHIVVNLLVSCTFLYLAFKNYAIPSISPKTYYLEFNLSQGIHFYLIFFLLIPMFYRVFRDSNRELPTILRQHIRVFTGFLIPFICFDLLNNSGQTLAWIIPTTWYHRFTFISLTSLLSSSAIYIVIRIMLGLRFLNIRKTVESKQKFDFITQFRDILEQLSYATALKELAQLTQTFFQTAFKVPLGRVRLYIRKADSDQDDHSYYDIAQTTAKVEQYLGKQENSSITQALHKRKIFIRDDIHFSAFYEDDSESQEILPLLNEINADVFLPIFERTDISAYIIVERDARPGKLYTNKERDEMLIFTTYVSNIINILKYSNLEALHQRHKQITEELYHKHQEINQYKESIRSFMRSNKERKVGILFYKYRKFTLANEAAQELVGIDLNANEGHPLTQAIRALARRVQEYKTSQISFAHDAKGQKIIINGIPSLEERATIVLIHYPEVSDIIKTHFDQLKDPSMWDYVLYLETTQSGQLINRLIPGNSEKLLSFKINLLSTALSKKATLLDLPEEDLISTVEVLHNISLRQSLHTIKLTSPEKADDVAIKLFGHNPLIRKEVTPSLLEKLDNIGTVFIQNVEYLGRETQKYLAEFIALGYFHKFKSDHKVFSNVRIICSTNKNLLQLVHEGTFLQELYNELEQTSLAMPPMHELSEHEVTALAQGFADQIVTEDTYKNLLSLTDKDTSKLYDERPLSLHAFKERVHQLLVQKSSKHNISEVTKFDPAYNVSDPDIAHAVRLGKKALKDPHIMAVLWHKFKSQSKIATLLGVNRSSVNRRCQEYNLK
jgi:transcriptional regulator of aromatic amino acid metabolism